ncbi:hypothetical protein [Hyalangium rubrum]|uniref:Uncharacterized protein n=1 Tax=Hyalangium rubrum TaxID=3103134 RepID=A0ABU5GZG4_9BACT|nr:hypothetical protein [Hyalangium sp. s54d21]MDY7226580.1 hypothetical protein [Hyalangium sp. s54d21]
MSWASSLLTLTLATTAVADEAPPKQTLVFYNARLALRDDQPTEALKLWLLRNNLVEQGERGIDDEDFRSVVWAALGDLGMCQDGFPKDERGAGLWPLALHNWVVHAATKGPPPDVEAPFDAFEVGRQQRFISLNDVLSTAELRSVTFFRTSCLLPRVTLLDGGQSPWVDLSDRLAAGRLMRRLLEKSLRTLVREKVQNVAAVEARIFDLDLALAALQARRARQEGFAAKQRARSLGVSEVGAQEVRDAAAAWPANSEQAAFLRRALSWRASEWLTLSRARRLSLFAQARPYSQDPAALERLVLAVIDGLIERGSGEELESWIGFLDASAAPDRRGALVTGERGKRLLELEPSTGFRERAAIALHRGVAFLEAGQLEDALRSFAYTMAHAEEGRDSGTTLALARRWLSYVLSSYRTNEHVLAMLRALVPPQEYNVVAEDLIWKAALRADARSFELAVASLRRGSALDARVERLRSLAAGRAGEMVTELREAASEEPYLTLRFVRQLLEKLEAEEADVRTAHIPTLKLMIGVLDSLAAREGEQSSHARTAGELIHRAQAILEGLGALEQSVSANARALSPRHEAFAGAIRLAPADPLPWPFRVPEPEAPSAFAPLLLEPVEWRDAKGVLVLGWRLTE